MPFLYNYGEQTDMLKVFFSCNKNSRQSVELYRELYPDRITPSHMKFTRLESSLKSKGKFLSLIATNENNSNKVLTYFIEHPHASIRNASQYLDISYGSIQNILKRYKWHPLEQQ